MANEAGDMKTLGNFSKLIELVSVNADYNPANAALTVASLNTQKTAASTAISNVGTQQAPFKAAVNDRQTEFDEMRPVATRVGNMLKASGADTLIRDDVKTLQRKISGSRKSPKVKNDPNTPQNEAVASQSASQQGYDNLLGNYGKHDRAAGYGSRFDAGGVCNGADVISHEAAVISRDAGRISYDTIAISHDAAAMSHKSSAMCPEPGRCFTNRHQHMRPKK